MGADAYVALPITFAELHARLQAILRRASQYGETHYRNSVRPLINLDGRNRKITLASEKFP